MPHPVARTIGQHVAQRARSVGEELLTVLKGEFTTAAQTKVDLVNQFGGVQRAARAARQLSAGQGLELVIDRIE